MIEEAVAARRKSVATLLGAKSSHVPRHSLCMYESVFRRLLTLCRANKHSEQLFELRLPTVSWLTAFCTSRRLRVLDPDVKQQTRALARFILVWVWRTQSVVSCQTVCLVCWGIGKLCITCFFNWFITTSFFKVKPLIWEFTKQDTMIQNTNEESVLKTMISCSYYDGVFLLPI